MSKNQNKKKKKIVWQQYIGFIFSVLIGAVCGVLIVMNIENSGADKPLYKELLPNAAVFIVGLYAAMVFHAIVHEAGHLVFGLLSGYKFGSFRVFSFMWMKENGRIKFRKLKVAGTAGQCIMIPPDMKDGKIPFVLYNLGGSFMNTIVSAVFLGAFFLCSDTEYLSLLMFVFAAVGFAIAVTNAVPMRLVNVDNDGYNTLSLRKSPEAVEAFWVQMKIAEQSSNGVRLKDMPAQWFAVPTDEAMKNSMVAVRGVYICNRLMDEKNFEEADRLMAHMLEIKSGIVGIHRDLLICDRMYIELIRENRRDVIEEMQTKEQKKFMKSMKNLPSVLRTEYARALLSDNDTVKAEKTMEQFEKSAKIYPYPGEAQSERELMEIAENIFRKTVQSTNLLKSHGRLV